MSHRSKNAQPVVELEERIDARLLATLSQNFRSPYEALSELVDNANLHSELSRWENRIVGLSDDRPGIGEDGWRVLTARLADLEEEVDTLRRQAINANRTIRSSFPSGTPAIVAPFVAAIGGFLLGRTLKRRRSDP